MANALWESTLGSWLIDFMSPLVDHLPKAAGVQTTKDVLASYIAEPKRLTRATEIAIAKAKQVGIGMGRELLREGLDPRLVDR